MNLFTPLEYLKIDVASNFGLDKESWDNRIQWFDSVEPILDTLFEAAEEPALFYAGVQAYRAAVAGQAIAYPISLDATASGAQLLAIMVGCEKSAKLCNVLDTGNREDFYTNIYEAMCANMGGEARIEWADTKRAIMTALYGSQAVPKEVFGEGELLRMFLETVVEEAPGVWELNEALQNMWDPDASEYGWILPDNFHVKVKVMDYRCETIHFLERPYEVITKVNQPTDEGRSIGANLTHSVDGMVVREVEARCYYDQDKYQDAVAWCKDALDNQGVSPFSGKENTKNCQIVKTLAKHYAQTGFLSARMVEHIDMYSIAYAPLEALWELLCSMPEKPFPVLMVHDCFRVHPNYGNDLRKQYNQVLSELAASDILASIISQLTGELTTVRKYGDIAEQIKEANYALS